MTTKDFIKNNFGTEQIGTRERRCGHVFADEHGNIYSYGYHYPLVFKLNGQNFINTAGYSSTTARHISWAWSALNFDAIGVKLNALEVHTVASSLYDVDEKIGYVVSALSREKTSIEAEMATKKRHDTCVYGDLERQLNRATYGLKVASRL